MWGDEEIAARLDALVVDYAPRELIWLGDSLHSLDGRHEAEAFLQRVEVPVRVLTGNHDRQWSAATARSHRVDNYFLHHGNLPQEVPAECLEIVGHHHPALSWYDGAGARLKLPALIASRHRIILPAFSPWAAGTPWNEALAAGETLFAIAPKRIFAVPPPGKSAVA